MPNLFFSYSHKDEELRNELETHLAMLKRQGKITTWHDRRITAGSDIDSSISSELENADVILLLISAHFLASDYCYDIEMQRALDKHSDGTAIVIPVVLHPCDWHSAPFGELRATPTDGKPVSMYANMHEAFSIVSKDIRDALEQFPTQEKALKPQVAPKEGNGVIDSHPRSSNLAIKKQFNDHDRDVFLENSYEYIARFFDGSLDELAIRNSQIQTRFKRMDETSFTASIYLNGNKESACSVWYGGSEFGSSRSINFSHNDSGRSNSFNEMATVTDDGYILKLCTMGMQSFGQDRDKELTQQGCAEMFWGLFIRNLQ
ncbi:TIR domain-containing protein [Alteromonas halophila]|uniref:TIR domain-containing protein n=1 Tax=Alteromonas halophila TaxID=516698 RepID=A0A918JTQ5_9ALTE|nr:toll/interleukin-1 receptor domain-containing protein [Alteromonas halophila]GGW97707.1 hypothetical protein GCM10007391_34660 [Alteromonas halophila]